jgi:hypothetical protein
MQAGFLGLVLLFLLTYIVTVILNGKLVNRVVAYYLVLIMIIPLYGAINALISFGQPFIFGILSGRGWLLLGVGIWFYYILVTGKMNFTTIEATFIFMAWSSLIFFSFILLTVDASQFIDPESSSKFVLISDTRGLRFNFQTYFISFGTIYYFVKYIITKNHANLLYFLVFIGYILFVVQGRTYIITLASTFLLYFLFNYSFNKVVLLILKLVLFLSMMLLLIQVAIPDYLERMSDLFIQMFTVFTGKESEDSSANARIFETLIVWNYFTEHPFSILFGTGSISHQWNDGYESIFGYFYPWDIGILGGLFMYGIVGFFFLFLIPIAISVKTIKKVVDKKNIFIITMKYLLLLAIISAVHDSFYFEPIKYVIPLFILLAYLKVEEKNKAG